MCVRVERHRKKACGWHVVYSGRVEHAVDLDHTVARRGPDDDGAGNTADDPEGPEVGEHDPEGNTTKDHSCPEALRQNAERAGKARRLRRCPSLIPTSRPRASACCAARGNRWHRPLRPRRGRAPANKPREKAFDGGRDPQVIKSVRRARGLSYVYLYQHCLLYNYPVSTYL